MAQTLFKCFLVRSGATESSVLSKALSRLSVRLSRESEFALKVSSISEKHGNKYMYQALNTYIRYKRNTEKDIVVVRNWNLLNMNIIPLIS